MTVTRTSQNSHLASKQLAYVFLPLFFLLGAVIYNVVSLASLGTVGGELYAITSKTEELTIQNQKLTETLAKKQSLNETLSAAQAQGFVPISSLTRVETQGTKVALGVSSQ